MKRTSLCELNLARKTIVQEGRVAVPVFLGLSKTAPCTVEYYITTNIRSWQGDRAEAKES